MTYRIYRDLQLPFGKWVESIREARNLFVAANKLQVNDSRSDWSDLKLHAVVGGIPEE